MNALTGMLTVDEESREIFRSLGASRWQTFIRLVTPSLDARDVRRPKTAAALALVGAVVGEFISAERGLGVLVQQFSYQLAVSDAFAVILMLMFLGLLLYGVMEWIEPGDGVLAARRAPGRAHPAPSRARPQAGGARLRRSGGPQGGRRRSAMSE